MTVFGIFLLAVGEMKTRKKTLINLLKSFRETLKWLSFIFYILKSYWFIKQFIADTFYK